MSEWKRFNPPKGLEHCKAWMETYTGMSLLAGIEDGKWHMSIAHPKRYPNWDEIHEARYFSVPNDVFMVMHLPPKEVYVNIHKNCFQLWEACSDCAKCAGEPPR